MDIEQKFHEFKQVVREAGTIAKKYFDEGDTNCEIKGDKSVVTKVDMAIEAKLVEYIKANFPNDAIIGEEGGEHLGTSGFVWHIDPIDGTDNFLRKIAFCGISVARLGDTAEDSFGIVYNPITDQMFSSFLETEGGVFENERVCKITPEPLGGRYFLSVGPGKEPWMKPARYKIMERFGLSMGKGASLGCTAMELAYLSANRIDAYISFGLKSYDYAAGLFLAKAAGGVISVYEDGGWKLWSGNLKEFCSVHARTFFVSHPDVHQEMLANIGDIDALK